LPKKYTYFCRDAERGVRNVGREVRDAEDLVRDAECVVLRLALETGLRVVDF
jgi:hypothetical protein